MPRPVTTPAEINIVKHPLVAAKLSKLRATTTTTEQFRATVQELAMLLLAEAARDWATVAIEVQTPLQMCVGAALEKPVVFVPILRAGVGMLDGMLRAMPDAQVGHLGLYRDEKTLRPVSYYRRLPSNVADAEVLLLDPMLATGHSASEAVSVLKAHGAWSIRFVCIVACPAGIAQLQTAHPEVPIITAAVDAGLNDVGYIVPGLGDAGDRYFGTM
jgi:uracil phosphoribosyltransferase